MEIEMRLSRTCVSVNPRCGAMVHYRCYVYSLVAHSNNLTNPNIN